MSARNLKLRRDEAQILVDALEGNIADFGDYELRVMTNILEALKKEFGMAKMPTAIAAEINSKLVNGSTSH